MDIFEEAAEELRAKLKAELQSRAAKRDWQLPAYWPDEILGAVQYVFDQERIEVARRIMPGVASPVVTFRLTKD